MTMKNPLPEQIGKYKVQAQVGRGSMGVVYKALDPEIERVVAIKKLRGVFQPGTADEDHSRYGSLRDEARSAGNLRHPNIITVFEVNADGSNPYIVMDYVDGYGLDVLIKNSRGGGVAMQPEVCVYYLAQAALGLDYAHTKGIIHCDIKPSNLLIEEDTQQLYVLDFGIAKFASGGTKLSESVADSPVVGTPAYMSPEQIMNEALDGRTDVFSLGVVAFEMLSSNRPFTGSDLTTVMGNILRGNRLSLWDLNANMAPRLEPVFSKALAVNRDERYITCAEFVSNLALALYIEDPFKFVGGKPRVERPQAINENFGKGMMVVGVPLQSVREYKPMLSLAWVRRLLSLAPGENILSPLAARVLALTLTVFLTLTVSVIYLILKHRLLVIRTSGPSAISKIIYLANAPEKFAGYLSDFNSRTAPELVDLLNIPTTSEEEILLALASLRERGVGDVVPIAINYTRHPFSSIRREAYLILMTVGLKSGWNNDGINVTWELSRGLNDSSADVRAYLADLIGKYYYYELLPDLSLSYYSEQHPTVKEHILRTLKLLKAKIQQLDKHQQSKN